jgi:uncharacterized RDD family membrane protein YckC
MGSGGAPRGDELAGRFTRFAAAMVDGILLLLVVGPVQFATGFYARSQIQDVGIAEQIAMNLLGMIVWLVFNGYLLFSRGQTIGKLATGIQIVDYRSGTLLPFVRAYVFRYLWTLPFAVISWFLPMAAILIGVLGLIDALMIFGGERRCLHDNIAGSKVVLYREGRTVGH